MKREEVRDLVNRTFYASLEESKSDVNALPPGQLQALVRAVSDSIFAVFDGLEEDTHSVPSAEAEEVVLWTGRPFMTIRVHYELTSQRLRIYRGLIGRHIEEIDLVRVRDTKVKQHAGERLANIGDITVYSSDTNMPEIILENVDRPLEVRETIRNAYLAEQKRRGLRYREND